MKHYRIAAAAVGLVSLACARAESKLPVLGEATRFQPNYREAAVAVAESIKANGERAEEFHVAVKDEGNGVLSFELWHKSALTFRNRNVAGNPGGKCRTVRYDLASHKVISSLLWQ